MTFVTLSIVASTLVLIIFRLMERFEANTRHSITISYLIAALIGFSLFPQGAMDFAAPWFIPAAIEGAAFYLVFRLMARTAQVNGLAVASIASKMSVVIPISIGIVFLNESASLTKLLGILTGIAAVVLCAGVTLKIGHWRWPVLVFIGSGVIDASFKLFQVWNLSEQEFPQFITTIFMFAFMVGVIHHFVCEDKRVSSRSIFSGAALGAANFGTVFFILKALALPNWESSTIYPINNFGVVALSTLTAVLLFREKLTRTGWAGFLLAVASIGLLF